MKLLIPISMIFSVFLLSGCDEIYTVEQLKKDPDLLKVVESKCKNGEYKSDHQNCENMRKVSMEESYIITK